MSKTICATDRLLPYSDCVVTSNPCTDLNKYFISDPRTNAFTNTVSVTYTVLDYDRDTNAN